MDVGNGSRFTFGSGVSLTYAAWIYTARPVSGNWRGIIYHDTSGKSQGHLGMNTTGFLEGGTGDGSAWQTTVTTYAIPASTWVHVAMTLDRGTNTLKFYANGVQVGSASLLAGILSLLTSIAGLPELDTKTKKK